MTTEHEGEPRDARQSSLATVGPDGVDSEPEPAPTAEQLLHIGRHVVIRKLGAGAMGVVFAAYDPELDRKLAIKLIRPGKAKAESKERMQREAQAMAKVSHPNVISIYDVGTFEGQVYIAMELVTGTSLGDWLAAHPITERQIDVVLDLFVQAGRGLAAAHEVKLVHRDFKPDNVLVGDDGRVRVLDFGLARALEHAEPSAVDVDSELAETMAVTLDQDRSVSGSQGSRGSLLDQEITRAGSLVGTPAYMPPEHLGGARTDARGDQFSFCVALWEGIYGERPFVGDNIAHMFGALISGRITEPPSERRAAVPDWLHAAILRGINSDPTQRWPDMQALLGALTPPPARGRWWVVAGALTLASAALGFGLWSNTREREPTLCTGFDTQLVGVWDDARRQDLRATFEASQRGSASASADAVIESLDGWTTQWLAMRKDTCVATHVRGDQSPELLDLRMLCLDRRLAQFGALVEVLQHADGDVIEQAASAASSFEGVAGCADVERLRGGKGPPEEPALAAKVAELEAELDHVEALDAAGSYAAGLTRADALREEIEATAWPPLQARYKLIRGALVASNGKVDEALEPLVAAIAHAQSVEDHHLAADAFVELLWTIHRAHDHFDELELWATLAAAEVARTGDVLLEAKLHRALGKARWEQARYDEAIVELEAALALREAKLDAKHLLVVESRNDIGHIYESKGENERARVIYEDTRAAYVAELGPNHPKVSETDRQLGGLEWKAGNYAGALKYYERALEVRERDLGKDHLGLTPTIGNIGATYAMMKDFEKSIVYFERAAVILRKGGDPAMLAGNLDNLANAETQFKRYDRARALMREAYDIRRGIYDDDHPALARSLFNMAQLELEVGDAEQARVMLERALALREDVEVQLVYRARTRWKLAEALWTLGENERVRELLEGARADYAEAGMAGREQEQFEAKVKLMLGGKKGRGKQGK